MPTTKKSYANFGIRSAQVVRVNLPDRRKMPRYAPARSAKRWCVYWRTEVMRAPSFFYFDLKRDAVAFAKTVLLGVR